MKASSDGECDSHDSVHSLVVFVLSCCDSSLSVGIPLISVFIIGERELNMNFRM